MRGSAKVVKGRVKEAAGALAGNDKFRARGRKDQAVGRVKQAGEKAVRNTRKSARKSVKKAKQIAQEDVDKAWRGY